MVMLETIKNMVIETVKASVHSSFVISEIKEGGTPVTYYRVVIDTIGEQPTLSDCLRACEVLGTLSEQVRHIEFKDVSDRCHELQELEDERMWNKQSISRRKKSQIRCR